MFYDINDNFSEHSQQPGNEYIAIIPIDKVGTIDILNYYSTQIPTLFRSVRFSKVEIYSDYIYGSINVPDILYGDNTGFTFIYNSYYLIFIDKNDSILQCFQKALDTYRENMVSTGLTLYYILDNLISEDLEKMSIIQEKLSDIEQHILSEKTSVPNLEITSYRNRTMKLYHYYIQLSHICANLTDSSLDFFEPDTKQLFTVLSKKIDLLSQEAGQIWEYTSQLRDIYQQHLEVYQNNIMKFLTIVTTLFMPLTLLTGWFGMNFTVLPGLNWRYGHIALFALCILIVIILCIIFKRRKWW